MFPFVVLLFNVVAFIAGVALTSSTSLAVVPQVFQPAALPSTRYAAALEKPRALGYSNVAAEGGAGGPWAGAWNRRTIIAPDPARCQHTDPQTRALIAWPPRLCGRHPPPQDVTYCAKPRATQRRHWPCPGGLRGASKHARSFSPPRCQAIED